MMRVVGNYVTMTPGDTLSLSVDTFDMTHENMPIPYHYDPEDKLFFYLRKNKQDIHPLLTLEADNDACFNFRDYHTKYLPCGNYVYSIEVRCKDLYNITIVSAAPFKLDQEVN